MNNDDYSECSLTPNRKRGKYTVLEKLHLLDLSALGTRCFKMNKQGLKKAIVYN